MTCPSELASRFGVHPTMFHPWKRALLEGASGVFGCGGKKAPEVNGEQVKELHAKIGGLAVANNFLARRLKPWTGKLGHPEIMKKDQGSQFTSFAWTDRLRRSGVRISMDCKGRFRDTIFVERLWRSLKYECVFL